MTSSRVRSRTSSLSPSLNRALEVRVRLDPLEDFAQPVFSHLSAFGLRKSFTSGLKRHELLGVVAHDRLGRLGTGKWGALTPNKCSRRVVNPQRH